MTEMTIKTAADARPYGFTSRTWQLPRTRRAATAGALDSTCAGVPAPKFMPPHPLRSPATPTDTRFRDVMGHGAWQALPETVRKRFSRHLAPGQKRLFQGEVLETTLSPLGRALAWAAQLAASPLPLQHRATGPATVLVTESPELGGQIWTRTYARQGNFPQTINSVKRFAGPTGIEEYLGRGLLMRLTLHADAGALVFRSAGFALALGRWRLRIPAWLAPGECTITHRDEGGGKFAFILHLEHRWLGTLVHQVAIFEEVV